MKVSPIHDRVLIEKFAAEYETFGGLLIPDTAKGNQLEALDLPVGKDKELESGDIQPLTFKDGEEVLIGKGQVHITWCEGDILGFVNLIAEAMGKVGKEGVITIEEAKSRTGDTNHNLWTGVIAAAGAVIGLATCATARRFGRRPDVSRLSLARRGQGPGLIDGWRSRGRWSLYFEP